MASGGLKSSKCCTESIKFFQKNDASERIDSNFFAVAKILIWVAIASAIITMLIMEDSCQESSKILSSVMATVDGTLGNTDSHRVIGNETIDPRYQYIWNYADAITPSLTGEFFIPTNAIMAKQILSLGNSTKTCINDSDCDAGATYKDERGTLGIITGTCVNPVCEVQGWNPREKKDLESPFDQRPLVNSLEMMTVFIKNTIRFPDFTGNDYTTNFMVDETASTTDLPNCMYDKDHERHKFCPNFNLQTIIESITENYTVLATNGSTIQILIQWDCYVDSNVHNCAPKYKYSRMDDVDPNHYDYGWYIKQKIYTNDTFRTLIKFYGIQFKVVVTGRGKRFSAIQCVRQIGSMLSYFGTTGILLGFLVVCFKLPKAKNDTADGNVTIEETVTYRPSRDSKVESMAECVIQSNVPQPPEAPDSSKEVPA